jgi:hypothetical protein
MYSPWWYSFATAMAETPYILTQSVLMVCISYWMVRAASPCMELLWHKCYGRPPPAPLTFCLYRLLLCPCAELQV